MELKTLKDIDPDCVAWFKEIPVVERNNLRKEAINWVKEMTKNDKHGFNTFRFNGCTYCDTQEYTEVSSIVNWIKYFFNINDDEISSVLQEEKP